MRRPLSLLFASLFLVTLYIPLLGASATKAASNTRIGMNVEQPGGGDNAYIDAFVTASPWLLYNNGWHGLSTLTANGYPTSESSKAGLVGCSFSDLAVTGKYRFYGEGDWTFNQEVGNFPIVRGTLVQGSAENNWVTTCQVSLSAPLPNSGSYYQMFINTNPNDPDHPPNSFKLIRPDYPAWPKTTSAAGYPFGKEFIAGLAPFSCLRFENWTCICNGAPDVTTWASRPQPGNQWNTWAEGNPFYGQVVTGPFISYENMIALCNATGCDMWLNIPDSAAIGTRVAQNQEPTSIHPTDWMSNMAKLLASKLDRKLHVYYEMDDEEWNWGGPFWATWERVDNLAKNNPALGGGGHGAEMGYLILTASQTMQKTLGSMGRPILAGQFDGGADGYTAAGLAYIATFGPPSDYIYGTAYAPYNGLSSADPKPTDANSLFQSYNDDVNGVIEVVLREDVALAKSYGINHICCYEWGNGGGPNATGLVPGGTSPPWDVAAYQDPRMGALLTTTADVFQKLGLDVCNYYQFCNSDGWGILPYLWYLEHDQPPPMYTALAKLSASFKRVNAVSASSLTPAQEKAKEKAAAAAAKAAAEKAHHKH